MLGIGLIVSSAFLLTNMFMALRDNMSMFYFLEAWLDFQWGDEFDFSCD